MKLPEFFGIDISSHSIKVAQVKRDKNAIELTNIGQIVNNTSLINPGSDQDHAELVSKIKQAREAAAINTKKVVASLPESAIFSRMILLPDVDETKLEQSIYFEAKQYLPIPVEEAQIDWIPITRKTVGGKKMIQVFLVAAPIKIVSTYLQVLSQAGLEMIALETDSVATARTFTYNNVYNEGLLVLDFGAHGTDISVIKGKNVIFSQSLGTGSDVLTKAIASDFNLEFQMAEQYKRTYGLLKDQAEGKIYNSLSPVMQIIVNEINKTLNYFRAHLQESTPKKIFIVGDGAKLPGLAAYLAENLGIDTEISDPVGALQVNPKIKAEIAQLATAGFTVAVGLALKDE